MAKQENNIFNRIRVAVSETFGTRLFRNHTGMIKDERGQVHRFGLCKGSSDGIGFTPVTITPEMVGKKVAVFTAIEAKTLTGTATKEQKNFILIVKNLGGFAGVARSDEEANQLISAGIYELKS